jgi:hypothetical protein
MVINGYGPGFNGIYPWCHQTGLENPRIRHGSLEPGTFQQAVFDYPRVWGFNQEKLYL